ncbi:MAG: tetratricopeptide repeat-containing serine protease family protein, partial [Planctomycetota bacterium]|nr:tetratricopeptide repeat-containing serine protease family protein [Planctomycetota bacterium]
MNKLRSSVTAAALVMVCCQALLPAETPATVEDALVMVITRCFVGRAAGNGFVIGDGTLVVTAHHLVFGGSEKGQHKETGLVSVVSPYVDDGCEATIIAADEELDLAVLKIPWAGHPALKLADDGDVISAERLVVTGIPGIVRSIGSDTHEPLAENVGSQTENLPVDYVAVRRRIPRFISLGEKGKLGDGWSGSPMLLPDSAVATGCFTTLNTNRRSKRVRARGPAVTQVRSLLKTSNAGQSLEPSDKSLPRRDDAIDAFVTFAQAYRHNMKDQHGWASDKIERFITLRPESAFAYLLAAGNAAEQKKFDLADQHYRKAVALNPEAPGSRFFYAQFLSDRQPDKALEMLEGLWQLDELKPSAALLMVNVLSGRREFQRAGELLAEALKLNPRNAYLRISLSGCQMLSDKPDNAIANASKAVELLPERGPFRGQLARMLEKAGRLDEAEKHFRELLNIEAKNPVVHLWLAKFLAKHRPEAKDEAVKEAQTALELPSKRGLPKENIQKVIQELQSETKPAP